MRKCEICGGWMWFWQDIADTFSEDYSAIPTHHIKCKKKLKKILGEEDES